MRTAIWLALAAIVLTSCGPGMDQLAPRPTPFGHRGTAEEQAFAPTDPPSRLNPDANLNRRVDEFEARVPSRMLPRDAIRPVYEPEFLAAADSPLQDDELVIGVALGGEAKAYPVTVLRFREMVNDELGGLPTLVTW